MDKHPLKDKRIITTRPEDQATSLTARLRELGAEPIIAPAIAIVPPVDFAPLDAALAQLSVYHWLIVTSANGVRILITRMLALGKDIAALKQLRIGAIGPATAQALAEHGLKADFIPTAYVAEAILAEIGDVAGQHILLPRADIARATLAIGLR